MNYTVNEFKFRSASDIANICAKTYIPNNKNYKGIVQIIHGMCEYIDRYETFTKYLLRHGFIVVGHDQLGHGYSVENPELRGYFGDKNGHKSLVEDAHYITEQTKKLYPNLPYFVFGHSMGSFVTRLMAAKYGSDIDGIILCGTGGPNPLVKTGIDLTNKLIARKGTKYKSKFLTELGFKVFNTAIPNVTNPFDWTTRDKEMVELRASDELSDFLFSNSGYRDLFALLKQSNEKSNMLKIPKDMHIHLISGDKDPVGLNGIGVTKVYQNLLNAGIKDVSLKLYKGARHELLVELNRQEVFKDLTSWLEHTVSTMDFNETATFTLDEAVINAVMQEISDYAIDGVTNNIGGPFGAAVLQITSKEEKDIYTRKDIKVISIARNTVISSNDPTCHAEVNAIREATKKLKRFDISDCILLTTGKSCPMCISAAYWAKIPLVYYACDYKYAEEAGFDDREISDYISHIKGTYALKEIKKCESIGKKVFKVWNTKTSKTQY